VIIMMQKTMFEIRCSECGKTAMIPFKPITQTRLL
jgi:CxxC-x17-CxxC domain-containing protein